MNKASKEILHFAHQVDDLKNYIMSRKLDEETYKMVFSNEKIQALILYYVFLNLAREDAFKMEIETIDNLISPYSEYNAERLKAMTSILKTEQVFTNPIAFNAMIECFNGHEITVGTLEPYPAYEIAWTCANVLGIWGSETFAFKGNALRYIRACLDWESWELPPVFLSFPVILDMYETKKLEMYASIIKYMQNLTLKEISELANDKNAIKTFEKTPFLLNYMVKCSMESLALVRLINETNQQLKTIFE